MYLQPLVDYFNDRFEAEHHSNIRPFIIENGLVSGIFGPIQISSVFESVRQTHDNEKLVGHIAQISVTPYTHNQPSEQLVEAGNLLTKVIAQPVDFQSIINLDRLCRTVHMLNYLNYSQNGGMLFLDVDPRHILGVQQGHGAYFEESIIKCGLATQNVVISMAINSFYALHHTQLLDGLNNYRRRSYKIALNIGSLYAADGIREIITKLSADYLRVNAPNTETDQNSGVIWSETLNPLTELQNPHGGKTILQQVKNEKQADIAASVKFDLVQGDHYDKLITDHLRCL
ncbi:hypothetical protein [Nitrosomonas ureae]|uniref:EAL domain-containing protein n=1 Tax=Nitrosomonas ureae TaxID=44577 RepID=A0A1H5WTZ4_9PROT|nr:hypothetical protein [Nitrosomonas ureae]SEG02914.1 hypothetical protein SAMN05216334_12121 [Nitrosomonas ureae]